MLNLEELKDKINKVGYKLNPRIGVNEFSRKNGRLLVSVKNLETNEISKPLQYHGILKGKNPWSNKLNLEELKDKINKIGSKLNPRTEFNQFEGYRKTKLLVSIRNLETNEISKPLEYIPILKGSSPWSNKLNLEELKEKINKVGSKLNPRVMVNEFSRKNGKLLVSVRNLETNEISKPLEYFSLLKGHNPWSRKLNLSELKDKINKIGSKLNPKIGFNQFEGRNKWGQLLVSVRNLETNEISKSIEYQGLIKGSNPFPKRISENQIKKLNKIGSKLNPRIEFNRFEGRNKWGNLLVSLRNLETNEISKPLYYHDILKGHNPWSRRLNLEKLIDKVNKIGSKLNPRIEFNRVEGRNKFGALLVSVKNLETNEISKPLKYHHILKGHNPWNKDQNRVELREIHPRIEKIVKKYGFSIEKHYRLGKREFIDFRISHQKLKYNIAIEAKQSDKFHTYSKEQQKRYRQKASLKQHNIKKLFFVDPKGAHKKHGFISYSELETTLKQIVSI